MSAERKNPFLEMLGRFGRPDEAIKTWEKWMAEQLDGLARNEHFLGNMGKAMESSMLFKAQMNRVVEQSLHNMRLPSLGDVEEMHARFDQMERLVDRLSARLDSAEAENAVLVGKLAEFSALNTQLADRLEAALGRAGEAA